MAAPAIGLAGVGLRFVFAFALVVLTWNPTRYNFVAWAQTQWDGLAPLVLFVGIVLLMGWIFFVRTAAKSLGGLGLILCLALAGTVVWTLFYFDLVTGDSRNLLSWIVLVLFSAILAAGMSWAHLRNRWSGQATVDEVDNR
ncbi:MAG TPA: DUF6524 family protein [Gammaproteobacteria bacterium]|nr:DUF6524 family protein [Gammaproteobacteria bacterium]